VEAGDAPVVAEAEVEVAMGITTITVVMRRLLQPRCTMVIHRHHIAMGAAASPMTTRMDLPRILLDHHHRHHHTNTGGRGTDRVVPGHIHRRPATVGTRLTRMGVGETHRGGCRMVGADITLGPRTEADTVEVVGEDMAAAAVAVAVVLRWVMVMETAEETAEGSTMLPHIQEAIIQICTMAATAQVVVVRREDAVEAEVTEFWQYLGFGHGYIYATLTLSKHYFSPICLLPISYVEQSDIHRNSVQYVDPARSVFSSLSK
jgi:hypothetical protein